MRSIARGLLLASILALAACAGGGERRARTPDAPRRAGIDAPETRQCLAEMRRAGVRFDPLPDRDFGGGCLAFASVKLTDIGVPTTNLTAMTCPLARTFAAWVRNGIAPAARVYFATELVRVESFGSYSCRNVNGAQAGRRSEHASANAVDIAAFVLADGRRISIKGDWHSPDPQVRTFLRTIHASACKRFRTVLSPDYNALHADHLHLDMGRGPYCR
jgi:hypothetical protein